MKPLYRDEAPKSRSTQGAEPEDIPLRSAEVQHVPSGACERSFEEVYEAWFDEVAKWVRAMGGPEADRADLVQEVFVVVHRRLQEFDGDNLAAWLYQIARRKVRDFRRLQWAKRIVFGATDAYRKFPDDGASPLDSLETGEKKSLLMHLLGELNQSERAAVVLFEIEGYSGKQISELQRVPVNTVWARIHQARNKLNRRLTMIERGSKTGTKL